jgi:DNA invertase Pin-like site-specific DNA recombinase
MTGPRYVTYFRVSTQLQRRSGLGLEGQRKGVERYLDANPGTVIEELTEIESGRKNDRPKFERALWLCRVFDAKLVIARLDRLARNTALIAKLMEDRVDFVAADMPLANRFTVHILAAVAEYESAMMSQRIRAALAVARSQGKIRRGQKRAGWQYDRLKGAPASGLANTKRATARAKEMAPLLRELRDRGHTVASIAREFTAMEILTPRNCASWSYATVRKLFVLSNERLPTKFVGDLRRK